MPRGSFSTPLFRRWNIYEVLTLSSYLAAIAALENVVVGVLPCLRLARKVGLIRWLFQTLLVQKCDPLCSTLFKSTNAPKILEFFTSFPDSIDEVL